MLPIIFQHVRELAEAHSAGPEREQCKIITPFPPAGEDFPEFTADALAFADPPADVAAASLDTLRAYEFFRRTDSLYYDYSYGIRSENYLLSSVCEHFFRDAQVQGDNAFGASFAERRDAFLNRFRRSTVGDLGKLEFRYTTLSPVAWSPAPVVLGAGEIERLKAKAEAVYQDLDLEEVGFAGELIEQVKASNYASINYELGSFDVIRGWLDPGLFESREWSFGAGSRTLYGESDPIFSENDVRLCYAQRFYLIRNYSGAARAAVPSPVPVVRDQRAVDPRDSRVEVRRPERRGDDPRVRVVPRQSSGGVTVDLRRRTRNVLIQERARTVARRPVVRESVAAPVAAPTAAPGMVWVAATAAVPGHWERQKSGALVTPPTATPPVDSSYRVAAVKCRILPRHEAYDTARQQAR